MTRAWKQLIEFSQRLAIRFPERKKESLEFSSDSI
jgi:hypothetical protein